MSTAIFMVSFLPFMGNVGKDGAMYANRCTPDGYWVNSSDVWVNPNTRDWDYELIEMLG